MKYFGLLLDIFSKKQCYSCKKEGHFLCENCKQKLHTYTPFCYVCKKYSSNFYVHDTCKKDIFYDQIIVFTHYKQDFIKRLLQNAKYYKRFQIFDEFIPELTQLVHQYVIGEGQVYLTYPPLHFFRYFKRGFNQSYIIAKKLGWSLHIPCLGLLKKTKHTQHQAHLDKLTREKNLFNVFAVKKTQNIQGSTIILVDDVVSTGTTLNECAKALKKAGAKKVIGLAIASD